jgi:biotin carboxylase
MRERLAAAGFDAPAFTSIPLDADVRAAASRVRYPCVLKPTQLSASRGVIRADDPGVFEAAFRRIADLLARERRGGPILVESYLPGAEVALEGVLDGGSLRVLALFDKPDPLEGPYFEETLYVTPSRLAPAAQVAFRDATARAAEALGLDHGPVHTELRWDGRRASVVEIAPRSIGGLCSRALRFGDASLEEVLVRHAVGQSIDDFHREERAAGVLMIPIPRAGRLEAVRGADLARLVPGIEDVRVTATRGESLVPLPEGARYLGFVFARAAQPAAVEAALRAAHQRLEFDIEKPADQPETRAIP